MKAIHRIKPELILSAIIFFVLTAIAIFTHTTGDTGDSISHYLYSHYAFKYPQFFFDHWAKPLFELLSAPFSQLGFIGIQLFNALCAALTALFTFYTARNLNIKRPYLVFVFLFFAPLYFKFIFTGLTEYLFALVLILGIYFSTKQKHVLALIIISFLPLVRSEGLLLIAVFGCYYFITKKYKLLPYLITGQLIYTLVGAFFYKDVLWVFNEIPYAKLGSPYGKGHLFDFVKRLNYVIEKPIYALLAVGSLTLLYQSFKNKSLTNNKLILVFGSFLVFFVAHSIFWWLGIFNSMGLPRVMICVLPQIAILGLIGLETIAEKIHNQLLKRIIIGAATVLICVYPFTYRSQGVVFNANLFSLPENELISEEVSPYIKKQIPDYAKRLIYYSNPYLSLTLNIDHFDYYFHREMSRLQNDTNFPNDAVIIWDDWYSVTEGGIALEKLTSDSRFVLIKTFERRDNNRTIRYCLFKMKATTS